MADGFMLGVLMVGYLRSASMMTGLRTHSSRFYSGEVVVQWLSYDLYY